MKTSRLPLDNEENIIPGKTDYCSTASSNQISIDLSPSIDATILASFITRSASHRAFEIHKRSMTSPDVIMMIGRAMEDLFPCDLML